MSEGLEAAFARLEGVVTTEIKHLSNDVKTLTQRLDAYPTQRDLAALETRVATVEDNNRWIWRTGVGFALSVIAGLIIAYLKYGH